MAEKSNEYVLDFVIPCGTTGPTGPTAEPNICFISYMNKKNIQGDLDIEKNKIYPTNSSNYTIIGQEVQMGPGLYEITYSGYLKKPGTTGQAVLHLLAITSSATTTLPDMDIELLGDNQYTYFSSTGVFEFDQTINLCVSLGFYNTPTVETDHVNVLIKKLN